MSRFVVTGTDTGIGKTVFSAGLAGALRAHYWKPVQSGLDEGADRDHVAHLAQLPPELVLEEAYRLTEPLSPHRAAEIDAIQIDPARLSPPALDPLVIEGAGGALVPITRSTLYADLFAWWNLPVIVVARTGLGTINHTLLTIEALRARGVPLHGVAFAGDANDDNEQTIAAMGKIRRLGRLPRLDPLTPETLAAAFAEAFPAETFL
ncbi:MAG: dethiobiotin synthase [Novosphingobium aromaticivorans]|nr:dethiobiotin synthase [Novosphingobium aromaticivorans]